MKKVFKNLVKNLCTFENFQKMPVFGYFRCKKSGLDMFYPTNNTTCHKTSYMSSALYPSVLLS